MAAAVATETLRGGSGNSNRNCHRSSILFCSSYSSRSTSSSASGVSSHVVPSISSWYSDLASSGTAVTSCSSSVSVAMPGSSWSTLALPCFARAITPWGSSYSCSSFSSCYFVGASKASLPAALSCSSLRGWELHRVLWNHHRNVLFGAGGKRRMRRRTACSQTTDVRLAGESSKQKVQSQLRQEANREKDLKEWMEEHGLKDSKVQMLDRLANGKRDKPIHYVAASEDLQPGDVALAVPFSLVVTLERVLGDETLAELLTTNKLSELACLALYLMYEKKQGKGSFWYPYIRELDRQRGRGQLAVESPLLWSRGELNEHFAGSPMKEVVLERLEGIKREYQELDTVWFMAGSLFKQYPFDIPTEAFSFEIFKQAFVAVQSCVVHLQGVSLARRFCLVPLGPPLLRYQSSCRAMLKAAGDYVQLDVDRAYHAGDPLVVWCGPQPNTRLLLNYGFVDPDNPYDRLSVEASLNTKDPLYQEKRIIVQKENLSSIQTFQIFKGKEKEAVLGMLPYMRLGHVADPADMKSVNFAQGPICPVQPCNERAILDQLVKYFTKRLSAYRSTIIEDIAVMENEKSDPKKRVATQLILIEKEILSNALAEVNSLVSELPDGTIAPCTAMFGPTLK